MRLARQFEKKPASMFDYLKDAGCKGTKGSGEIKRRMYTVIRNPRKRILKNGNLKYAVT
jgi:hypothetical protein